MQTLKDEIRDNILEVSKKIFVKKGFNKSTMRDIADGAHISVGNIYRYFKNKDEILETLISDFEKELLDFSDTVDDKLFNSDNFIENNRKEFNYLTEKLLKIFMNNETTIYILSKTSNNEKLDGFKDIIARKIGDKIIRTAKACKNNTINKNISYAIATGLMYGMISIINRFDDTEQSFQIVKKDLKSFIEFTLNDLVNRIKNAH